MRKGKFIVFEGLDGAGTTTQLSMLADNLQKNNVPVFVTAEPVSSSPAGREIRAILRGEIQVLPETLAYLYVADRYEHIYGCGGVMDHVRNGEIVICDRYLYSSIAYQSVTCNRDFILDINSHFPKPDMVFYIDTPVDECISRIASRKETPEIFEKKDFLCEVKKNYDKLFANIFSWGKNTVTINGNDSKENIASAVFRMVQTIIF